MNRDDVVLQNPEDLHLQVPVFHTVDACAGAVTAHLLRRIAYRAGAYAPGIQDQLFHELNNTIDGGSIDKVQRWFLRRVMTLARLGYRLQCRRSATPTKAVLEWVRQGRGHRGAMLTTNYTRLHPKPGVGGIDYVYHAVGLTMDKLDAKSGDELVMIDPWPGLDHGAKDRAVVPPELEAAHKDRGFHALMFYWSGWS